MSLSKVKKSDVQVETKSLYKRSDSKSVEMGIAPEAMSFIIDSLTNLYPNPIESSVREVISNAMDATVLVTPEKRSPIVVESPTSLNPYFTVIDCGTGMSPHDIETIYSQYGGTIKREDFTQLGAFGLGAKAPLAYCSEFFVTSTKDGVTTSLTVGKKADGNKAELHSIKETQEPNGTKITIPVQRSDLQAFQRAINRYKEFTTDLALEIDGKLIGSTEDYIFLDTFVLDEESGTTGRVWVRKDAIGRRIKSDRIRSYTSFDFVLSGWIYKTQYNLSEFMVELKPGVVDFVTSRDDITKNERYQNLIDRLTNRYAAKTEENFRMFLKAAKDLPNVDYFECLTSACLEFEDWNKVTHETVKALETAKVTGNYNFKVEGESISLHTSELISNSGFNPFDLLSKSSTMLYGAINVGHNIYSIQGTLNRRGFRYDEEEPEQLYNNCVGWESGKVTSLNQSLIRLVDGNPKYTLINLAKNFTTLYGFKRTMKTIVLENFDQKAAENFRKLRPFLIRRIQETGSESALFLLCSSKLDKTELDFLKSVKSSVTVYESSDFFEKARIMARDEAKSKRKDVVCDTVLKAYIFKPDHSVSDNGATYLLKSAVSPRLSELFVETSVEEIVAGGVPVIISDINARSFIEVLNAITNRGEKIADKYYCISLAHNKMYASDWNALRDYDKVYVHREVSVSNSKAAITLCTEKAVGDYVLDSYFENLAPGQILSALFARTGASEIGLKALAKYSTPSEEYKSKEILGFCADIDYDSKAVSINVFEAVRKIFPEDTAEKIFAFAKAIRDIFLYRSYNIDEYYMANPMLRQSKVRIKDEEFMKALSNLTLDLIEGKMSEYLAEGLVITSLE